MSPPVRAGAGKVKVFVPERGKLSLRATLRRELESSFNGLLMILSEATAFDDGKRERV